MKRKAPTLIPTTAETLISGRREDPLVDDDAEMNPLPDSSDPPWDPDPNGFIPLSDPSEEEEASRNSSGSSSCS